MNLALNREERHRLTIESLVNGSDEMIISMLHIFKESGELFILEPLLDLISSEKSDNLKRAIMEFLSAIKDNSAIPIIVSYLANSFQKKGVIEVITACWQSSLDFSQHLGIFFDILIKGKYQTAFEAFTVIENSLERLTSEEIAEHLAHLKAEIGTTNRDKQLLLLEMVSILSKAKRKV